MACVCVKVKRRGKSRGIGIATSTKNKHIIHIYKEGRAMSAADADMRVDMIRI